MSVRGVTRRRRRRLVSDAVARPWRPRHTPPRPATHTATLTSPAPPGSHTPPPSATLALCPAPPPTLHPAALLTPEQGQESGRGTGLWAWAGHGAVVAAVAGLWASVGVVAVVGVAVWSGAARGGWPGWGGGAHYSIFGW